MAKPRTPKTPRQRAEEALGVAERRVERLTAERAKHQGEVNRIVGELADAEMRRDYLAQSPDLEQTQPDVAARPPPPA
jgi:hypothetical protein